jgi:hypothetical protein
MKLRSTREQIDISSARQGAAEVYRRQQEQRLRDGGWDR